MIADRLQRLMTTAYRVALTCVRGSIPEGSRDDAVAVFTALQRDAVRTTGWPGLFRCWIAEAASLVEVLTTRSARESRRVSSSTARRGFMAFMKHDVRDAWRSLRRSPGYTCLVVGILALGIGINTAIFSEVDALLFKPLPYAHPDQLVFVSEIPAAGGNFTVSPAAFLYLQAHARSFDYLEARVGTIYALLTGGDPEGVRVARVSVGYFDLLGVRAFRGRTFVPDEGRADRPCGAVISHRLWTSRFGASSSTIGGPLVFSGVTCTVIGVLPDEPALERGAYDVYVPLVMGPAEAASFGHVLTVVARVARGVSIGQARAEVATLISTFNEARGPAGHGWTGATVAWRDRLVRADARQLVWVLFAAVSVVLLVSCVNVASLSLARTAGRRREIAIRAALGASRWRVFRALATESLALAVTGGALGVAVGAWTLRLFSSWLPPNALPADAVAALDGRTLAFTLVLSLGTGLLFGTLPAWSGARSGSAEELAAGGRTTTSSRLTTRLRAALLVAEVALAMLLVTGATLLVTSFLRLTDVEPGFTPDRVLTVRVTLPPTRYRTDDEVVAFYDRALENIRRIPAVVHAGAVTSLPLGGWLFGTTFDVKGVPAVVPRPSAHLQHVTPDYFDALGIPVLEGRAFQRADNRRGPLVAIVNRTFARRFAPDGPTVGRRLVLGSDATINGQDNSWEIVGVIGDVKTGGLADGDLATPEIYVPLSQVSMPDLFLAVRSTSDDVTRLVPDVRAAVRAVDPELALSSLTPMRDRIGTSVTTERFRTGMVSAFAILAGVLACLGVYAVGSQAALARVREMGIRLALGATPRQVVALVLRQGLTQVAIGLGLGVMGVLLLVRFIQPWLFATRASDPTMLVVAAGVLGLSALVATWLPARRVGRVDPLTPLRSD